MFVEVPAVGNDGLNSRVVARLDPARVRPVPVGHHKYVDFSQVVDHLSVAETPVHADVDTRPAVVRQPLFTGLLGPGRGQYFVVEVEAHLPVRAAILHQLIQQRPRVDVGAQVLRVDGDDRPGPCLPRSADRFERKDMRMWQHVGYSAPAPLDLGCGPIGQRDQGGCGGEQDIESLRVRRLVCEVRVLQIVHRDDERHTPRLQYAHSLGELVRGIGVETEVDVEQIATTQPVAQVIGLEQPRWPPLTCSGGPSRYRIAEQGHDVGVDDRCHVRMGSGNRCNDQYCVTNQMSEVEVRPGGGAVLADYPPRRTSTLAGVSDPGRTRHYGEFYGQQTADSSDRPLWLVIGNCQAEALRSALDTQGDRPYRTVRVPPVHELDAGDIAHLHALLARASVLLSQPIRPDYRGLPLGTEQMAAALPAGATVLRWPVIRYAGLYPFQVIVRRPADRSVVPPPVPYHDLRTIAAARADRAPFDPWDVDVSPAAFRAVAAASTSALALREQRDTDVGISDVFATAGCDAAHAINHPGNTVLAELARRVLAELGVAADVRLDGKALLGSVYAPLEQRVIDALGVLGAPRHEWWFHGESIDPNRVHRRQLAWYQDNADFLEFAVERHGSTMELLGLLR